jgi:hypothetical protein
MLLYSSFPLFQYEKVQHWWLTEPFAWTMCTCTTNRDVSKTDRSLKDHRGMLPTSRVPFQRETG